MNDLEKRIITISYNNKLSHIGSCLNACNIIDAIYEMKTEDDIFVLSAGHCGLALYAVLEKFYRIDAEELWKKHGTHPNRDMENGIFSSSGSLGHGIGIALGAALADRKRNVFCLVTDGECSEGVVWETIRIAAEQKVDNLVILVSANGFGAYKEIDLDRLEWQLGAFVRTSDDSGNCPQISFIRTEQTFPHLKGINAHYKILNKEEFEEIMKNAS